jgi:death-on-curing protein
MSDGIRWLTQRMILSFHGETLQRHGGSPGLRDEALLESALARPHNRAAYKRAADDTDATVFDLMAEYCAGIIRNHPFVDGNKRTGLLSAVVFVSLNGHRLTVDEAGIVTTIEAVASGDVPIDGLSIWFARNCLPET